MIREACTTILKSLSDEQRATYGLPVLTTRRWIQGISWDMVRLWIPDAAPSKRLLSDWRDERISWETFLARYKCELECRLTTEVRGKGRKTEIVQCSPVAYLAQLARQQTVTVLCWERDQHCHRHTLVKLVEQELLEEDKIPEDEWYSLARIFGMVRKTDDDQPED